MKPKNPPINDAERLEALDRYQLLDSAPESAFDDLTRLAARLCDAPIALITLVNEHRVWFKSRHGLDLDETPRDGFFCDHAIRQRESFLVADATRDSRFAAHPLVTGAPALRAYAGVPLLTPDGHALGTLCVFDLAQRDFTAEQAEALRILARQVITQMELHRNLSAVALKTVELRQAEAKYREIFENVVEGIFQTTPSGQYLAANRMLARIYGYTSPTELIESLHDISRQLYVAESRRDEFVRLMQERGVITGFESEVRRRDGSTIWISENVRAVNDNQGRLLYYEGTVEDVTARKQAEDALRKSELLYHSLVEALPQSVFRKDADGRFTFVNQFFCKTVGRASEEIIGKTDAELFPPELASKYRRDDERVMRSGIDYQALEAHANPNGGNLYVRLIKTALRNTEGEAMGIQGVFWDVTKDKKLEEELNLERDLLRALMDNVPDRIYFKDTDSRFILCNKALAERIGLKNPDDVVGKTDYDFHPLERAREFQKDEHRIIITGQPMVNKVEEQTALDGSRIWASVTKVPTRNRAGYLTGIIGISRDITALKHAEDDLALARDQALESARLKTQFLATMSHEIRTPMNGIIGMLDLLLATELKPEQDDFAETASHSAHALLELLNNILDLSKIEAGRLALEQIDFGIREIVEDTVELLAPTAHAKEIELACLIPADFPAALRGDPARLRQMLLNLVGNAVKFTETGGVQLRVSIQPDGEGIFELRCEVRDTGIGIAPEEQEKIFQAFTQADGSTTRRFGGTGLGLSICQQLVEMMGGQIGLESEPGRGSTFWFTVPIQAASAPAPSSETPVRLQNLRVLFVAGDAFLREALHENTAHTGITAAFAATGAEALAELQRAVRDGQSHELVVFDINLPDMEGLAFGQAVEAETALAGVRLVALTPINRRLEPEVVQAAGLSTCLLKPLKRVRLLEGLARAMTGATAEAIATVTAPAAISSTASASSLRLLLADDNLINQKVALLQLRRLGFDARVAHNGREALAALDQPFDVVLMDCHMPEMDGFEATRQIRAREQRSHWGARPPTYIIALTADSLHDARDKCLAAGMNDYIKKPVQLTELEAAMQRAHYRQPAPTQPAAGALPTLDLATLESLRALSEPGQPDLVTELVDLFLGDVPPRLKKMQAAAAAGDAATVYMQAHTIKGSAGNLGAKAMAALCQSIERPAKTGTLAGAEESIRELMAEYERMKVLLVQQRRS